MAALPNGTAGAGTPVDHSSLPPVVGINFGNSYASIAVFTKEGLAECIANEDGERQIACAVSFHGEEIYIGNQAKQQLIKNSQNTITGFHSLLGKKFSEIPKDQPSPSAPVIQHPDIPDEPAYKVDILQPSPTPLVSTTTHTPATLTPAVSLAPTPRSEPIPATRFITVSEVTSLFLKSLVQSASDFLGKPILGSVISVPSSFTGTQKDALLKAAEDAGVHVLQIVDEAGAVAAVTTTDLWINETDLHPDRTELVVDLGASSLSLNLLSVRDGLAHVLAASTHTDISGSQIDDKLIQFFTKEFTKKTKAPLSFGSDTGASEKRAEAKLRLAVEHTKRTIAASPGAATCSVESLIGGLDFTGTINRMRFDMVARPIYAAVASQVRALLVQAGVDAQHVDEIVYVGGSTCLPGLNEHLCLEGGFSDLIKSPFDMGTIVGGGVGDPTEIIARGCALQAELLFSLGSGDAEVRKAFEKGSQWSEVSVSGRTVGLLFPGTSLTGDEFGLKGAWVPVLLKETALPARRTLAFDVGLSSESKKFALELWEVSEGVRVENVPMNKTVDAEEDDDEEEEEEVKYKTVTKERLLGTTQLEAKASVKTKGHWGTKVEVQCVVDREGGIRLVVKEVGHGGTVGELVVEVST